MSQFHERYGLTPIINACGKMTHLGAAAVPPEVTSRVMEAMSEFVDMPEFLKVADAAIADATGAEAGTVTHCAAAGITVTCAGAMTGDDLGNVLSLPDTTGLKNEVIIQKGHAVNFGAPVTQMIRMSGATAVEFGEANRALPEHMARAINANTAAAVFVLSHHTVQHNQLSFAEFVAIADAHGVPVIVDGAAEAFPGARTAGAGRVGGGIQRPEASERLYGGRDCRQPRPHRRPPPARPWDWAAP